MTTYTPNQHVGALTSEYRQAIAACFPAWKGRKVRLSLAPPTKLDSYWDGGSRDYFAFYNTITRQAALVHSNHPFFEAGQPNTLKALPSHVLLLEHTIFCGKDMGITIHATTTPTPEALSA